MDTMDRVSESQCKQGFARMDPLAGIDVNREYYLIRNGLSNQSERIQGMIVRRYELGA